jgi:hypothetical protein
MDRNDKEWIAAGIFCVVGGGLIALLSGKQAWFAYGGLLGAGIVGYRMHIKGRHGHSCDFNPQTYLKHILKDKPDFAKLGAPEIPAEEVPNVGTPESLTRKDVEGYPVQFRTPDVEVHTNPMDDMIRPHFVGPLGPANDPVRYWG